MMDHQPHVVVLRASNLRCKNLKDDIFGVIFNIVEEHSRDLAEGLDTINVVYVDELLPTLYENSRISQDQLPTQRGIVRCVVALGRYLQNPLAMVATLCGPGKEILSLKLHSLECFLTPDEKYEAVEVRGTGQAASRNHVMDPLDDTRIHLESYELAKKMDEDIYCEEAGHDIDDMDEETQEMAVERVKKIS